MTLAEIATAYLPLLERFKPDPMAAGMEVVLSLASLSAALEKHGKHEMGKKISVLMLATIPIAEMPVPEGTEKVAAWLVQALEDELRSFLE
jgi:hypothetical protein